MTCSSCSASMPAGADWCGQCYAPVAPVAATRFVPAQAPVVLETYSRWRKTDSSFGPVGRVSWTVGVAAVGGLFLFSTDPFAIGGWFLIAAPLILRGVWKRARVT
jgi:hypothetical protein